MLRRNVRWSVSVMVGLLAVAAPAQDLDKLVAEAEALGARTGIAVCDDDGRPLYRHRVLEGFAPASNLKLLTAAAVVSGLGADFRFTTRFVLRAGRLVVQASGDPNWIHDTPHDPAQVFGAVAAALQARGVAALGGIDLDVGTFTGPSRPSTWPQDQLYTYYCAPTGPFVLEQGVFVVRLAAGGGERPDVSLVAPRAAMALNNQVTLQDKAKDAVYGAIDGGDGGVRVTGRFARRSSPVEIRTAMAAPELWYRKALEQALQEHGLAVGQAQANVADATVLEYATPLASALERMLEDSSNFDAEQCLRVLGAARGDGSLAGGVAALTAQVKDLIGQMPEAVALVDGSGLSKQNRVTAGTLITALFRAAKRPGGDVLCGCLPVAGKSGTLTDRFVGSDLVGRVHAKTGWIRGASALTGFVTGKDGRARWFSILMNYDPKQGGFNKDLKALQERMVAVIDGMVRSE